MTRSGIVTFAGAPNSGKSTLLNRIVGQKLSITSQKPQSTRDRVVGIHTTEDTQLVIFDTPGLLEPKYELQAAMRSTALRALNDADVIVYLADATDGVPAPLTEAARLTSPLTVSVISVLNKSDLLNPHRRAELEISCPDSLMISAMTGDSIDTLMLRITTALPVSPFLYPEDDVSTQSVRFFVSEMIRETVLEQLHDEVPYSVACGIEEFRESGSPVYIRAVIYVERESQKRIIIGAKGSRIREIGQTSRKKIEGFVAQNVYLDLWVKVLPNWRRSTSALERFGYHIAHDERR
ncbi:MAG TPA: GTPase Era [Gemmatimonadaceae bacterium]|nr:GTPase Era [Gemmatimonadaceae bacterium]